MMSGNTAVLVFWAGVGLVMYVSLLAAKHTLRSLGQRRKTKLEPAVVVASSPVTGDIATRAVPEKIRQQYAPLPSAPRRVLVNDPMLPLLLATD